MAAHADDADIVEEDDTSRTSRIDRLAEEPADQRIVAARLVHAEAAHMVELRREAGPPLGQGPAAEVGPALDDDAGRLALGVGIDDAHQWSPGSAGGVPCVWKLSIVLSPQACPFFRSVSVQVTVFQSGSRISRAPAFATSTRLPAGS